MINKTTRGFILILVAAFLSVVEGDDFQEINCKDEVGNLCSRSIGAHAPEMDDGYQREVGTAIGVSLLTFFTIVVIIFACLFCVCCPLSKYRNNKGTVYGPARTQPQPAIFHTQTTYNPQPIVTQTFPQPQYPGNVYPPGHAVPHTHYPPSYSAVTEQQRDPWIGHHAGAPQEPPPYYPTSPPNEDTNTNFTSK